MFNCYTDAFCVIPLFWNVPFTNIPMAWGVDIVAVLLVFVIYAKILKNEKYYKNGFLKKDTVYLIGGAMWDGKTRLMTKISKEIKEQDNYSIVYSNYYNWYSDLFFSSFGDFDKIQRDIQFLWINLNFDWDEKDKILKNFKNYFAEDLEYLEKNKNKIKEIKKILNWKKLSIIWLWDEFHLYLYGRQFMSNFKWEEGKKRLERLHQTRHSNQLLILATQDTDSLDLDIRQIADKEIEVKEWLGWLFFWFNLYKYKNSKYQNWENKNIFTKINLLPFYFFNWYNLFKFFKKIIQIINNNWKKILNLINQRFNKNYIFDEIEKKPFEKYNLDFLSKYNVNISLNIYEEWKIFDIILKKLKKDLTK